MIKFKKFAAVAALSVAMTASAGAQDYPARDLQGTIMWGAGGATDVLARVVSPVVEDILGKSIVLVNRAGGSGAISVQYVNSRPADGYDILYGSETPQVHKVLGIGELDYDAFTPVIIFGTNLAVFAVANDAPWQTFAELLKDIRANPGRITAGTTGSAGTPVFSLAMLDSAIDIEVNSVPFDGEGPGLTALQGGHVDFMPTSLPAAAELIRAGRLRALAVLHNERLAEFPDIPAIVEDVPELDAYLPWGTFQGILVKKDTPDAIIERLTEAYLEAAGNERVREFVRNSGMQPLNIIGEEARTFVDNWRSLTSWVLYEVGLASISPEKFGISRP
ncbi:Bug family tripartite tricarboxylate transporter substrate binding protein [Pseudochelatococcus sp. B33]